MKSLELLTDRQPSWKRLDPRNSGDGKVQKMTILKANRSVDESVGRESINGDSEPDNTVLSALSMPWNLCC